MKLKHIAEGTKSTLMAMYGPERLGQFKQALSFMPPQKAKHSLRVGATAAKSGLGHEEVEAAILHDYIERGGDLATLDKLEISPRAHRVIKMLSLDEKESNVDDTMQVQQHIEQMLKDPGTDLHDKNVAIIVKCADRIDNVKKRIKQERLTPQYRIASRKLFDTLIGAYDGDPELISHVKKKISKLPI